MEFVLLKIRKLSSNAREAAQIASCLGNRFDLETLAATAQTTTEEVVSRLVECIDAGFITEVLRSPDLNVSQPHKYGEGEREGEIEGDGEGGIQHRGKQEGM